MKVKEQRTLWRDLVAGSRLATLTAFSLFLCSALAGQNLLNGPIITHTTMHSATVWAQLDGAGSIRVEYWLPEDSSTVWSSRPISAQAEDGYIIKLLAREGIEPGKRYQYRLLIGEEAKEAALEFREGYSKNGPVPLSFQSKPRWRWIPDETSGARHSIFDFRIAMGSCSYINQPGADREGGKPYGSGYQIFESIYEKNPDLMLWLGDNVYYRENDYDSREGLIERWTNDRQLPQLKPLMANTINYATWDDHDYGPNDIGSNYWMKEEATEVFSLMWGNPSAGLPEAPGIFSFVNWGDVNIYLLDNRTHLTPAESQPELFGTDKACLGKEQIDWLVNHLAWAQSQSSDDRKSYPARFNLIMVGNQVLNASGNAHGLRNFEDEWQYLMDRIAAERIRGVVFLSGDVHFGEVNQIEHKWGEFNARITEITSSPLTAGSRAGHKKNDARLDIFDGEADRVGQNNFVTLDFEGPLSDRRMVIRYWDSDGKLINQKAGAEHGIPTDASIIRANELTP